MSAPPPKAFLARRASVASRIAAGKALRAHVPRVSHALYEPPAARRDPVLILQAQSRGRLPDLVRVRYTRMLDSPFSFLRGASAIMATDLASTPASGLIVQACGDAHVANFGVFATAERNLAFGINDFDETYPAPWEWDLKRLVASAAVCARFLGADRAEVEAASRSTAARYRLQIRRCAQMSALALWYARIDGAAVLPLLSTQARKRARQVVASARERTNLKKVHKMVDLVDGRYRLTDESPRGIRDPKVRGGQRGLLKFIESFLRSYVRSLSNDRRELFERYQLVDVARKIGGVGSVGTRCWILLLRGADDRDAILVQVKQALPSAIAAYSRCKSRFREEGERVVTGQRMIQGAPDVFLGWGHHGGMQFHARQFHDISGSGDLRPGKMELRDFITYCGLCGWALALAHAKSGDPAMIAGYIGRNDALDSALASFAMKYADQTQRDFDALRKAAKTGRIAVVRNS